MLSLFQKKFKKEEKFQFNTFNSIQARKEKSATVRRRGRRGGRAVAAVSVGQMLERADPDVVARGLATVSTAVSVVVAEAEGGAALAAEEPGAAPEEPARVHVDAAELVGVAELRVVDGVEGHHPAPREPS